MAKAKRIFVIADFKDELPRSIRIQQRMWIKGFLRLYHDVQRFSHRNIMSQFNPFYGRHLRRLARCFVRRRANEILAKEISVYHPDIVLILSMKYLDAETVRAIHFTAPTAILVSRDGDPFHENNTTRLAIAKETAFVTTTRSGRFLKTFKDASVSCCAFIPNICDPDIQYRYDVEEKWKTDIIFAGKVEHRWLGKDYSRDSDRYVLLQRLSKMPNVFLIRYEDYFLGNERLLINLIADNFLISNDEEKRKHILGQASIEANIKRSKELNSFNDFDKESQIHGSHISHKGQPSAWKKHFNKVVAERFNKDLGKLLINLGYEENSEWIKRQFA